MTQNASERPSWHPDASVADVVRQQIDHRRIHWIEWARTERDSYGNFFRYRAGIEFDVVPNGVGPFVYDVFLSRR